MKVNSGSILLAFFAVVSGLVGVHLYREANRPAPVVPPTVEVAEEPAPIPSFIVPMVSRNLTPGQTIAKDDVALVRLTREQMDELGLKDAFMTRADQILGKTVKRELRRGSTFDTRDFYPVGQGPGIVHRLKPGLRAITVTMLPTNALIGFAGAGQTVDVLFHYGQTDDETAQQKSLTAQNNYQGGGGAASALHNATSTLIQGAEILALNQQTMPVAETKNMSLEQRVLVTLAVFPREAELLRMASGHGELSLTLRGSNDEINVPTMTPRTVDELIDVKQQVKSMEIFRGKDVTRLQFGSSSVIKRTVHDGSRDSDARFEPATQPAPQPNDPPNGPPADYRDVSPSVAPPLALKNQNSLTTTPTDSNNQSTPATQTSTSTSQSGTR